MSKLGEILQRINEAEPPGLPEIGSLMQQMRVEGLIRDYSIGGSVAIAFYSEPFDTEDVDIFCHYSDELATNLSPFRKRLEELGVPCRGIYCFVFGIKVQLQSMAKATPLEQEAFNTAITVNVEGIPVRVFQLEYAMAVKVEAGRDKDWNHLQIALQSAEPDMDKFADILKKFGLWDKWQQHGHR